MNHVIAAISTAMSPSGIGIIRMSGEEVMDVISKVYKSKNGKKNISAVNSHTIHYGYIYDGDELIDEALVMVMYGPKTYTGENTVEINCHGGVLSMRRVLETVLKYGAKIAEPGEFTKRAFLNGKLDLSQAEAVMDVIESQNEYALKSSLSQLKGSVRSIIEEIRSVIIYHIAYIESALDDPEHISVDGYGSRLQVDVDQQIQTIGHLIKTSTDGKKIQEGIKTVILGKPNAGKSSILNLLVGENKAIVTDIAGTTRDILEEYINIEGITLHMVDTAGIRDTEDIVEQIGVSRAKEAAQDADLILYVVDSSSLLDENDRAIMEMLSSKKAIILLNKSDLETITSEEMICGEFEHKYPVISMSAKEETGITNLSKVIKDMFFAGEINFNNEVYITNARHKAALEESLESLKQVEQSISMNMPEDFFSIDLMNAYQALGKIIGEEVGEDLVNEIFSKFCTGK